MVFCNKKNNHTQKNCSIKYGKESVITNKSKQTQNCSQNQVFDMDIQYLDLSLTEVEGEDPGRSEEILY